MKKLKSTAKLKACQTKAEVQMAIRELGDLQRQIVRLETKINDEIGVVSDKYAQKITPLQLKVDEFSSAVQIWCEANRSNLLVKGLKTAKLITGEVAWRIRPPSVSIRGKEAVIDSLKKLGLTHLIRTKEEPNKEAILEHSDEVADIKGISITSSVEDFIITPFENKESV